MMRGKRLLYFADPMCSWCWGFSPAIHKIAGSFSCQAPIIIHVGGLRAGNTQVMDASMRDFLLHHWHNVHKASNQPFDFSFNMPKGFIYDTEPACRAVKTMQKIKNEQVLTYFSSIQHAFYNLNLDVTDPCILAKLAIKLGVTIEHFELAFNSDQVKQNTINDFMLTRQMGVNGFPCLIGQSDDAHALITQGYQPYPSIETAINKWLTG